MTVDGKEIFLYRGATVRHALIQAQPDGSLIKRIQEGAATVYDDTVKAPTDLGGALYEGQRLTTRLIK